MPRARKAVNTLTDKTTQDIASGLTRTKLGSRDVIRYYPELALAICERIAEGETVKDICTTEGYPSRQTFHRWVLQYPELNRAYRVAKEMSATSFEEEAISLGREIKREPGGPSKVRAYDILMNQLRWSASKRNPREYSDRGTLNITVPVQINTSLDMGEKSETQTIQGVYTLEASVPQEVENLTEALDQTPTLADPREVGARQSKDSRIANRDKASHQQRKGNYAVKVR